MELPLVHSLPILNDHQKKAIDLWWSSRDENDYDCKDNFRYANKAIPEEVEIYDQIAEDGCCGFVDVILKCDDGSELMYGFNYGH